MMFQTRHAHPKQVIGEASGWWLTHSIIVVLEICPDSLKVVQAPCILAKCRVPLGSADAILPPSTLNSSTNCLTSGISKV